MFRHRLEPLPAWSSVVLLVRLRVLRRLNDSQSLDLVGDTRLLSYSLHCILVGCVDSVLQRRYVAIAWLAGKEKEPHEHRGCLLAARHVAAYLCKHEAEVLIRSESSRASALFEGEFEHHKLLEQVRQALFPGHLLVGHIVQCSTFPQI